MRAAIAHFIAAIHCMSEPGGAAFRTFHDVNGDVRIFDPLLTRLCEGPASFAGLEAIQPLTGRPGLLDQSLQALLWSGAAHPVVPVSDPTPSAGLNRHLLRQWAQGDATPALGSRLAFGPADLDVLATGSAGSELRYLAVLKG